MFFLVVSSGLDGKIISSWLMYFLKYSCDRIFLLSWLPITEITFSQVIPFKNSPASRYSLSSPSVVLSPVLITRSAGYELILSSNILSLPSQWRVPKCKSDICRIFTSIFLYSVVISFDQTLISQVPGELFIVLIFNVLFYHFNIHPILYYNLTFLTNSAKTTFYIEFKQSKLYDT